MLGRLLTEACHIGERIRHYDTLPDACYARSVRHQNHSTWRLASPWMHADLGRADARRLDAASVGLPRWDFSRAPRVHMAFADAAQALVVSLREALHDAYERRGRTDGAGAGSTSNSFVSASLIELAVSVGLAADALVPLDIVTHASTNAKKPTSLGMPPSAGVRDVLVLPSPATLLDRLLALADASVRWPKVHAD